MVDETAPAVERDGSARGTALRICRGWGPVSTTMTVPLVVPHAWPADEDFEPLSTSWISKYLGGGVMQRDQETGEIARDLDAQIWSAVNSLSENNWHIGELLVRMRDQQFYKDLDYKSCRAYLQAHENTIGLRRAYDVMRIVDTFGHVQHAARNDDEKARIRAKLVQSDATKLVVLSRIVNKNANHVAILALVEQVIPVCPHQ